MGGLQRALKGLKKFRIRIGLGSSRASHDAAALASKLHNPDVLEPAGICSADVAESKSSPLEVDQRRLGLDLKRGDSSITSDDEDIHTEPDNASLELQKRVPPGISYTADGEIIRTASILASTSNPKGPVIPASSSKRSLRRKPVLENQAALMLGLPEHAYVTPTDSVSALGSKTSSGIAKTPNPNKFHERKPIVAEKAARVLGIPQNADKMVRVEMAGHTNSVYASNRSRIAKSALGLALFNLAFVVCRRLSMDDADEITEIFGFKNDVLKSYINAAGFYLPRQAVFLISVPFAPNSPSRNLMEKPCCHGSLPLEFARIKVFFGSGGTTHALFSALAQLENLNITASLDLHKMNLFLRRFAVLSLGESSEFRQISCFKLQNVLSISLCGDWTAAPALVQQARLGLATRRKSLQHHANFPPSPFLQILPSEISGRSFADLLKRLKIRIGLDQSKTNPGTTALHSKEDRPEAFESVESFASPNTTKINPSPTKIDQRRLGLDLERGTLTESNIHGLNADTKITSLGPHEHSASGTEIIPNGEPVHISSAPTTTGSFGASLISISAPETQPKRKPVIPKKAALLLGLPEHVYMTPTDSVSVHLQPEGREMN
ncbi:hypothetical protein HDK90DRAFT_550836 [Phyllosticta capitalensis]|uniref:Uncharacterized protein n=1 Tax=Phyllosticta capitalensis TaxID=121624 RepID=A0ABR1YU26_9PEZI